MLSPHKHNKYLIIPVDPELGNCDQHLRIALEKIAKKNGYSNGKKYLEKVLGCSGNSVKNMIEAPPSLRTFDWNRAEFRTKDAYVFTRKLDIEKFADVVNLITSEYAQIASKEEREDLLKDMSTFHNPTYQMALFYKSISGLQTIVSDPKTANRVNRIENAKDIAEKIINALGKGGSNIQP